MKKVGFKVYRDSINREYNDPLEEGKVYLDYQGGKARIRLLDGDNKPYFYIYSDVDFNNEKVWNNESQQFEDTDNYWERYFFSCEDFLFYMLDSLGSSYGCAYLEYFGLNKETNKEEWIVL